jgi:predicted pyridoxine 5'-phosphate oxidase superfamily flavin-nucleotide-binding protein
VSIALNETVTKKINNALADLKPVAVSYVDADGQPHLSLRGSVQVYSPDQLAIWVRHGEGGIAEGVGKNPHVALLYRDNDEKTTYTFMGRAHVDSDDTVRRTVFDNSPEPERNHDPELHGVAVVIDLDRATGFTIGGDRFDQTRG